MRTRALVLGFALLACGGTQEEAAEPGHEAETREETQDEAPAPRPEPRPELSSTSESGQPRACLPRISGCGCAYACAAGFQQADGSWGVVDPMADSALRPVRRAIGIRDAQGKIWPPSPAETDDSNGRLDAFFDNTPCGGECVAQPRYESCVERQGECVPGTA